jgi:hypothetical protein
VDLEDTVGFGGSSDPWGNNPTTSNGHGKHSRYTEFDSGSDEMFPPFNNGTTTSKLPVQQQQQPQVACTCWYMFIFPFDLIVALFVKSIIISFTHFKIRKMDN